MRQANVERPVAAQHGICHAHRIGRQRGQIGVPIEGANARGGLAQFGPENRSEIELGGERHSPSRLPRRHEQAVGVDQARAKRFRIGPALEGLMNSFGKAAVRRAGAAEGARRRREPGHARELRKRPQVRGHLGFARGGTRGAPALVEPPESAAEPLDAIGDPRDSRPRGSFRFAAGRLLMIGPQADPDDQRQARHDPAGAHGQPRVAAAWNRPQPLVQKADAERREGERGVKRHPREAAPGVDQLDARRVADQRRERHAQQGHCGGNEEDADVAGEEGRRRIGDPHERKTGGGVEAHPARGLSARPVVIDELIDAEVGTRRVFHDGQRSEDEKEDPDRARRSGTAAHAAQAAGGEQERRERCSPSSVTPRERPGSAQERAGASRRRPTGQRQLQPRCRCSSDPWRLAPGSGAVASAICIGARGARLQAFAAGRPFTNCPIRRAGDSGSAAEATGGGLAIDGVERHQGAEHRFSNAATGTPSR